MVRNGGNCTVLLAALWLGIASAASGETAMPKKPDASMKRPADPGGMRKPRDDALNVPSDPGGVVVPPTTGTEEIAKPPKNVDPAMDDATTQIDRKNRTKAHDKAKAR